MKKFLAVVFLLVAIVVTTSPVFACDCCEGKCNCRQECNCPCHDGNCKCKKDGKCTCCDCDNCKCTKKILGVFKKKVKCECK